MKPWHIIDPYIANAATDIAESFATEQEASEALARYLVGDEAGWCGCYVEKR